MLIRNTFFFVIYFFTQHLNAQYVDESFIAPQTGQTSSASAVPHDWHAEFNNNFLNGRINPTNNVSINGQYEIAYWYGRWSLNSLVYAYRVTKNINYLNEARNQINTMFGSSHYMGAGQWNLFL